MTQLDKEIINRFKKLLNERVKDFRMILFGSRARGDASHQSDMDIAIVVNEVIDDTVKDYISDCAWNAGFEHGIVVVPVVFSQQEWETEQELHSLLSMAINKEGVIV